MTDKPLSGNCVPGEPTRKPPAPREKPYASLTTEGGRWLSVMREDPAPPRPPAQRHPGRAKPKAGQPETKHISLLKAHHRFIHLFIRSFNTYPPDTHLSIHPPLDHPPCGAPRLQLQLIWPAAGQRPPAPRGSEHAGVSTQRHFNSNGCVNFRPGPAGTPGTQGAGGPCRRGPRRGHLRSSPFR